MTSNPLSIFVDDDFSGEFTVGDAEDDVLSGSPGSDALFGGAGDDIIYGNAGNDLLGSLAVGEDLDSSDFDDGRDTLLGGTGDDVYLTSSAAGGGDVIRDRIDPDDTDILFITTENTKIDILLDADAEEYSELVTDPETFGDFTLEIARPEAGTFGMLKSSNNLIIDLNRDGIAEVGRDLTIVDFFDDDGELGKGSMSQINNIVDPQEIVDFF